MASGKMNTAARVREIIEPFAKQLGLQIWDVRYVKEGASWFLRIFIDKPDGVTIDDCEALSRLIDEPLDQADPVPDSYYLEVSSPGLGRELTRPEHFAQCMGQEIMLKCIRPQNGQKEFAGILKAFYGENVVIATGDQTLSFPKSDLSAVRLNDDNDI